MKSHVAQLLKQPMRSRKMISVTLDNDQVELIEKLSLFFSRETNHNFTKNQVVEEAVKAFTEESLQYIAQEYDLDIRHTTLSEMHQYKRVCTVDIAAMDTVVLPVRDDEACKELLFRQQRWNPVQLDREKLKNIRFAAFCFGSPTGAITHYATIHSYAPAPDDPRKQILYFNPPEELGQRLEWSDPNRFRLRRPRYTVFSMLMEAKTIDELFGQ